MANTLETHMKKNTLPLVHFFLAFIMLLIGGTLGLLQGLNRGGVFELPASFNYYEVLTLHGILLILAFTTLFTNGYMYAAVRHTLGELSKTVKILAWSSLASFLIGSVLVVWMVLAGEATVLYTFYPPMQASPWFYIGLVFVVLCIWLAGLGVFISAFQWKRRNKGQHLPILAFFAVGIYTLVIFGSIGVTVEVLMLIPWAFGWTETINVMLSRTLFWSFGHTLVNVWYLVAISVWYTILPRIIGGRIFSDTLARLVVILIVILNVPGGFHHQIVDPAFSEGLKFMHVFMSLSIAFPSLMTAFAMFAVLERTGRKRGGRGLLGWLWVLPWGDVRFLTIMIAMVSFIIGGAGGIAQTNHQLNQVVHNSLWVVGHFHITVGVTVVMTFFGLVYWLIPHLSGRVMTPFIHHLGMFQTAVWTIGMALMALSMHAAGLFGAPRRTSYTTYGDSATALGWEPYLSFLATGGTLLFFGVLLIVYIVFHLMFFAPKGDTAFMDSRVENNAHPTPKWTENWGLWVIVAILIISMGYVVPLVDLIENAPPGSPPHRTW
ncbi:cbb3-type cytochrome c oxidase subunit I [Salinicoccus bachuensis]|uniref:Cbb3-type cytochrome c oxidase subunit I n=1 Tax=Salinicoccus bachuensis TaxID=3136731 RepID=A0ABZ3CJJ6_9STAP